MKSARLLSNARPKWKWEERRPLFSSPLSLSLFLSSFFLSFSTSLPLLLYFYTSCIAFTFQLATSSTRWPVIFTRRHFSSCKCVSFKLKRWYLPQDRDNDSCVTRIPEWASLSLSFWDKCCMSNEKSQPFQTCATHWLSGHSVKKKKKQQRRKNTSRVKSPVSSVSLE